MTQPGECNLRHAATSLFGDDFTAEMIGSARFPWERIPSYLIAHPPSVGLAFAVIFPA